MSRPAAFDVVIVGKPYGNWESTLRAGGAAWRGVRGVRSVALTRDGAARPGWPWWRGTQQFAIVFQIGNILAAPRCCWSLLPSRRAVHVLNDKRRFAAFTAAEGLAALAPANFASVAEARFPCVLKRTDLWGGQGVVVAHSAAELEHHLLSRPWSGRPFVLQAYVEGPEYAAHAIAVGGRLVWVTAYRHEALPPFAIRAPLPQQPTAAAALSDSDRADLERFLLPLGYDGPVCFDFKRGSDGRIRMLEINPRFGGSLFWDHNVGDLAAALDALLAHAKWMPLFR
ncbi:MAG: hypothetical protein EOP22_10205 [Hyphomicrobiales bacterium]|nr:MAG: hypothetical protein EOP22_10205 [Hyphomicrobiales bacterium]